MKRRLILNLILVLGLFLSLSTQVAAQGELTTPDDPGGAPEDQTASPPNSGVAGIAAAFSGGPSYDSGWVPLEPDEAKTLNHDLGGDSDDYVVDMLYKSSGSGINQRYYGGADFGAKAFSGSAEDERVGAYWRSLTTSQITVYRRPEDIYAEQVRVRIWVDFAVITSDEYDSGWISLTPGAAATTLNHALGGDADDYVVYMQYKTPDANGINQRYFGGADFGATAFGGIREDDRVGLYWRSLNNASITLFRRADDDYADEVRIRIWRRPAPTYDSGWVVINQDQATTLTHAIGGNANNYVVDMQYYSGGSGINQRYYGGADFGAFPPGGTSADDRVGAYWRSLTDSQISVYRRPEDIYASQVRIRIWHYWDPPAPDYDSGWVDLGAGASATTLNHAVGGDASDYLVNMQYQVNNTNGINIRYFGGADFGLNPAPGHSANDRVGAYWRSLTNSSITLFRRAEDTYAEQVRIRIWVIPKADFDSGWIALGAGAAATTLTHNLKGDVADYLVDLQYYSGASGVNQRYYGGADFGAFPPGGTSADDRVGAYWRSLSNDSITVYRRPDDIYAENVRVRIWRLAPPDYDSGWVVLAQDEAKTLSHDIGGLQDDYLVDMFQYDSSSSNWLNQRHLGGADFGSSPPSGYSEDDRVGAYWRSLTPAEISVYRRPQDGFADYVRIRIWDTLDHLYLPVIARD
ncbi:MAG: hypothetical protein PVG32_08570 [Anaerolineales bacterium]|jgi:hypothetical protein